MGTAFTAIDVARRAWPEHCGQRGYGLKKLRQPILPIRHDQKTASQSLEGPLANAVVVFTGALSMARGEAAILAAQAGANVRTPSTF